MESITYNINNKKKIKNRIKKLKKIKMHNPKKHKKMRQRNKHIHLTVVKLEHNTDAILLRKRMKLLLKI